MKHIFTLVVALFSVVALYAQQEDKRETIDAQWFKSHYKKAESLIPMRDGTKLYTAIYTPKNKKNTHPILLNRTQNGCEPYGKKSATFWQNEIFEEYLRGEYIIVFQDVRGYGKSLGNRDATNGANDAFDTAEWLYRKARKNNGKIGVWGFGEDAKYAIEAAVCSHKAIQAVSVQAPVNCEVAAAKLSTPILFVGGMFDEQSDKALWDSYRTAKASNPAADIRLVVGPWTYGAWRESDAEIIADDATPEFYRTEIEFPFFDHYLRGGESSGASASGSLIYYGGENCWREGDVWQSEGEELTLYLNEEGALYEELPYQDISYSDFVSDPQKPVPATKEGADEITTVLLSDQSFADGRADVLTFVTPVLDSDITAAGAISAKLYVKSSQPTIDLVVKLIDVADNGESEILLRSGIVKGQNIEPNSIIPITISMTDLAHTFMAGHRLKLQIHSTWSPILQSTISNHITLYHDKQHPSQVVIIQ